MKTVRGSKLKIAAGVAALLLLGCLVFYRSFIHQSPFGDKRFNRSIWAAYNGSVGQNIPRCGMYEDLIKNILKKGMPKQDIQALLGEPDLASEETRIGYNLGTCTEYSVNFSLEIDFDREGKASSYSRCRH